MALFARSFTWPGRVACGGHARTAFAAVRQVAAHGGEALRALSGYSLLAGLGIALGFARELTVASTFGLSAQLDVFVAMMTVQLFFGAQVGNALETVFISRVGKPGAPVAVLRSLKPAVYGLLCVNAGVVLCLWGGSAWVVGMLFPRFDPDQQALAVHTLHALLPPIVFASTAGLLRGALAVLGGFVPGFLAGSIVSVCTIISVLGLASLLGIDALTLGVAAGNLGVLGLFLSRVARHQHDAVPVSMDGSQDIKREGWFALWGAAAMVLVGELLYAGVALTERSLASWLSPGSIAAFFYASTIVSVPMSLFVVPLTTMLFPGMVEAFRQDIRGGVALLRTYGLLLLAASVVMVLIAIPFAQPIVETVLLRGRFSIEHARITASILSITLLSLPFLSLSRLFRNACYSLSDYRTPAVAMSLQWMTLAGLGLMLVPRAGAQGLAIAMVAGEAATLLTMIGVLGVRLRSI